MSRASVAYELLLRSLFVAEKDCRDMAKEKGWKIRRDSFSGIYLYIPGEKKKYFHGWNEIYNFLKEAKS